MLSALPAPLCGKTTGVARLKGPVMRNADVSFVISEQFVEQTTGLSVSWDAMTFMYMTSLSLMKLYIIVALVVVYRSIITIIIIMPNLFIFSF